MTTEKNKQPSLDKDIDNITLAEQLTSLARGIRRSGDSFSLFFVESNLPKKGEAVVETLTEEYTLNILSLNCHDIADKIFNSLHLDEWIAEQIQSYNDSLNNDTATNDTVASNTKVQVVILIGLEQLFPISQHDDIPSIIIEMNWRRNFYRELALPLVLILPTHAIKELATYASDFYDWYSGVYTLTHSDSDVKNAYHSQIADMKHPQSGIDSYLYANVQEKKSQINHLKALLDNSKNVSDRAYIYNQLGLLFHVQGKHQPALEHYENALNIDKEIGDKSGQGASLNNISQIYRVQGDYDTALKYLQRSLKIREEIGDKAGEGTSLNNISQIYDSQGDYDTALDYLQQSLTIQEEIGDKEGKGTSLNNISQIYDSQGDYDTALEYLQQSLTIYKEIGHKEGEGIGLNNISQIYQAQGDYDKALEYLQQSLTIYKEIGHKKGEGASLNNISLIYDSQGDYDKALEYLQHSLIISEEIGDRAGISYNYFNIGKILADMQHHSEHEQAQTYIDKSHQLAKQLGLQEILNEFD